MANIHLLDSDLFKLNGKNLLEGDIVLSKGDLGLDKVDNTPDAEKVVASANKFTNKVTINGVEFDGSADINIIAEDINTYTVGEDFEVGQSQKLILTSPSGLKFAVSLDSDGRLTTTEVVVDGGTGGGTGGEPGGETGGGTGGEPAAEVYDNILVSLEAVNFAGYADQNYELKLKVDHADAGNFTANVSRTFNLVYAYPDNSEGFIVETPSVTIALNTGAEMVEQTFIIVRNSVKHGNPSEAHKAFTVALAETTITNAVVDNTPVTLEVAFEADGDGFVFG